MIKMLYEPFQTWSATGSVYIISDLHFEDADCELMDPNWVTPQEQIDIINKMVKKNDTLVVLGDIGNPKWLEKIETKNLVILTGNHDKKADFYRRRVERKLKEEVTIEECLKEDIISVHIADGDYCNLFKGWAKETYDGPLFIAPKILLSHEPVPNLPFCMNIHGHDHSFWLPEDDRHFNIAANIINYTPINLGDLIRSGLVSKINNIHRMTIDAATERKE